MTRKVFLSVFSFAALIFILTCFNVSASAAAVYREGYCSADESQPVKWVLDSNGVMTISGNGAIKSYYRQYNEALGQWEEKQSTEWYPWHEFKDLITSVIIADNVTGDIPQYAFRGCPNIERVVIGDNIGTIGYYSFTECPEIATLDLGNVAYISENFTNCKIVDLVIPASVINTYVYAFNGNSSLKTVTIESDGRNVSRSIDGFMSCSNLERIIIPDNITYVGYTWGGNYISASGDGSWANGKLTKVVTYEQLSDVPANEKGVIFIKPANSANKTTIRSFMAHSSVLTSVSLKGNFALNYDSFYNCSELSSVNIQGMTSLGQYVFSHCPKLTSITIPSTVTNIDGDAFFDNQNLRINVDAANAKYKSIDGVLFEKDGSGQKLLAYTKANVETGKISSVVGYSIPTGTTEVLHRAFGRQMRLKRVMIPSFVKTVSPRAFNDCDELYIDVNTSNSNYCSVNGVLYTKDKQALVAYAKGKRTGSNTAVTIESSVRTINPWAFAFNYAGDITLPSNCVNIGENAFTKASFTGITFQGNLTEIPDRAFYDNDLLESITLPNSVRTIGESAFYSCDSLKFVKSKNASGVLVEGKLPDNLVEIKNNAFCSCGNYTKLIINDKLKKIGASAFHGNSRLQGDSLRDYGGEKLYQLTIPNNVEMIGGDAFCYCYDLGAIVIGENNKASNNNIVLSNAVFRNCTHLKVVDISKYVTNIPSYAFFECYELCKGMNTEGEGKKLMLPNTITSISDNAFRECRKLENIGLCENLISIDSYAFQNTALKSIDIPDSVTTIGSYVFHNDTKLTSVNLGNGLETIGSYSFANCGKESDTGEYLEKIVLPDTCKSIGNYTFAGIPYLNNVELNEGLQTIGQNAFYGCSKLKKIVIPNSVNSIGADAFRTE